MSKKKTILLFLPICFIVLLALAIVNAKRSLFGTTLLWESDFSTPCVDEAKADWASEQEYVFWMKCEPQRFYSFNTDNGVPSNRYNKYDAVVESWTVEEPPLFISEQDSSIRITNSNDRTITNVHKRPIEYKWDYVKRWITFKNGLFSLMNRNAISIIRGDEIILINTQRDIERDAAVLDGKYVFMGCGDISGYGTTQRAGLCRLELETFKFSTFIDAKIAAFDQTPKGDAVMIAEQNGLLSMFKENGIKWRTQIDISKYIVMDLVCGNKLTAFIVAPPKNAREIWIIDNSNGKKIGTLKEDGPLAINDKCIAVTDKEYAIKIYNILQSNRKEYSEVARIEKYCAWNPIWSVKIFSKYLLVISRGKMEVFNLPESCRSEGIKTFQKKLGIDD